MSFWSNDISRAINKSNSPKTLRIQSCDVRVENKREKALDI